MAAPSELLGTFSPSPCPGLGRGLPRRLRSHSARSPGSWRWQAWLLPGSCGRLPMALPSDCYEDISHGFRTHLHRHHLISVPNCLQRPSFQTRSHPGLWAWGTCAPDSRHSHSIAKSFWSSSVRPFPPQVLPQGPLCPCPRGGKEACQPGRCCHGTRRPTAVLVGGHRMDAVEERPSAHGHGREGGAGAVHAHTGPRGRQ